MVVLSLRFRGDWEGVEWDEVSVGFTGLGVGVVWPITEVVLSDLAASPPNAGTLDDPNPVKLENGDAPLPVSDDAVVVVAPNTGLLKEKIDPPPI